MSTAEGKTGEKRPHVIGVTGMIASGKSTAAGLIVEALRDGSASVRLIDADKIGHGAYAPGTEGFRLVSEAFGESVVQEEAGVKSINRKVLGGLVFGKPSEMKRLTDIVWPIIQRQIDADVAAFAAERAVSKDAGGVSVAVVEAAVLVEAGWQSSVDSVWVVDVDEATAKNRLMARNGLTDAQASDRIRSQLPREDRLRAATAVIANVGTKEELQAVVAAQCKALLSKLEGGG